MCTCRRLGVVAVLLFQLTPANNNGLRWEDVPELLSSRLTLAAYGPTALMFTVLMVLLLVAAFLADARLRYLSDVSPLLPYWLRPGGYDLRTELIATLLTRSTLARIVWVYPGFTVYSHAQLLTVLANSVACNAAFTALVAGWERG